MEERRRGGFRVKPKFGQVLGYLFNFQRSCQAMRQNASSHIVARCFKSTMVCCHHVHSVGATYGRGSSDCCNHSSSQLLTKQIDQHSREY